MIKRVYDFLKRAEVLYLSDAVATFATFGKEPEVLRLG